MTSEQFTVKFFNDVFNQQVDIEDLKKQLNSTRDEENKSSSSSKPAKEEEEKAPSAQHALKQPGDTGTGAKKASPQFALSQNDSSSSSSSGSMLEMCKASCLNYSEIILASILFLVIVLLCIIIILFVLHR